MSYNRAFDSCFLLIAIIAFLFLLPAQPVFAADITVGGNCSLADAITAANTNKKAGGCPRGRGADKIILTGSITLRSPLPDITSNITIRGKGFTISGSGKYHIFFLRDARKFRVQNLTLSHGTLSDGSYYAAGAAIACDFHSFTTVVVRNSAFRHNESGARGGAIGCLHGTVDVRGSVFQGNHSADREGGAIYTGFKLYVRDSTFENNSAYHGGALYSGGGVDVRDSVFQHNKAPGGGGAIYAGLIEVRKSVFRSNEADYHGGAIYFDGGENGTATFRKSVFENNGSDGKGASIYGYDGTITVVNSKLGAGGAAAIYSERGTVSIQ